MIFTVTDARSGAPISGASLRLEPLSGEQAQYSYGTTGSTGVATIEAPPGRYAGVIFVEGFVEVYYPSAVGPDGATPIVVVAGESRSLGAAMRPGATLDLQVTYDDGRVAPGGMIWLQRLDADDQAGQEIDFFAQCEFSTDGLCQLRNLPAGAYRGSVQPNAGHPELAYWGAADWPSGGGAFIISEGAHHRATAGLLAKGLLEGSVLLDFEHPDRWLNVGVSVEYVDDPLAASPGEWLSIAPEASESTGRPRAWQRTAR